LITLFIYSIPELLLRSNSGLQLANAFGVREVSSLTPKAFANFSPGFEHRENPGCGPFKLPINPERVRHGMNLLKS
jgi:hypothetical protein